MSNAKVVWLFVLIASICAGGIGIVLFGAAAIADPIPAPSPYHAEAIAGKAQQTLIGFVMSATSFVAFVVSIVKLAMPKPHTAPPVVADKHPQPEDGERP